MESYQLTAFGGPEVLERTEGPTPEPGPNEVRTEVHATSVNPIDVKVRAGGDAMGLSPPLTIGYDVAGVVDSVGEGVERFEPGDEVFYTSELFEQGTYAEYHVERADIVAHKPDHLSFAEAASLPLVACTAWEAFVERAGVGVGDVVLVHGVGGVGQQAVQLADAAGARVLATASPETTDLAQRLGADVVVEYTEEDFTTVVSDETDDGVDVVLDGVGGNAIERSIELLRPYGTVVDLVGDAGDIADAAKSRNATVEYTSMTRSRKTMEGVATLVEHRQLRPVVDSVLPLSEVRRAHERIEEGGLAGKLVLTVGGD